MTVTVVAGTSGGEGMCLARMLAAHAATSQSCLLHPATETAPFAPPAHLAVVPVGGSGAAYDAAIIRTVRDLDNAASIFIELPAGHPCSTDMVVISNIILVPMAPSQVSTTEGLRALAAIETAEQTLPKGVTAQLWVIAWDSVGGPAAEDRLIAAAKRTIRREPGLEIDIKGRLLPWGLPPLHWSEIDYICGLANRPKNSRIDDVLRMLRGLWMAMRNEPNEKVHEIWTYDLADLRDGGPHSDGTRMAMLSHDLHMIDAGLAPSHEDLRRAPQLSPWRVEPIISTALRGGVAGHPLLGKRRDIVTSPIMRSDPNGMWCRTMSRFYGLGHPEATGTDPGPSAPSRGQPN